MQFYSDLILLLLKSIAAFPLLSMRVEAAYLKSSSDPAIRADNFDIFMNMNV